jgi:hypothetical protein
VFAIELMLPCLSPTTIYTSKLLRRGHVVPQGLQAWMGELRSEHVMSADFVVRSKDEGRDERALRQALLHGQLVGVMRPDGQIQRAIDNPSRLDSGSSPATNHIAVAQTDLLHQVFRNLHESGATSQSLRKCLTARHSERL